MGGVNAAPGRRAALLRLALGMAALLPAGTACASRFGSDGGAGAPSEEKGTIRAVDAELGWYAIVPDSDPGTRYAPDALPAELRQDGLRVVFSGRVGAAADGVRQWGVPLELTRIRRAP